MKMGLSVRVRCWSVDGEDRFALWMKRGRFWVWSGMRVLKQSVSRHC